MKFQSILAFNWNLLGTRFCPYYKLLNLKYRKPNIISVIAEVKCFIVYYTVMNVNTIITIREVGETRANHLTNL